MTAENLGADACRWDLSSFYTSPDDPGLTTDLTRYELLAEKFKTAYQGKLDSQLGDAIRAFINLDTVGNKPLIYLQLKASLDLTDEKVKTALEETERRMATAGALLVFFDQEVCNLTDESISRQAETDETVKEHLPWIETIRLFKTHLLPEPVEAALVSRSPFGPSSWASFFDEVEAELRFDRRGEKKILNEMLDVMQNDPDAEVRAEALTEIHRVFGGHFLKYSAQTLNMIVGKKAVEDRERGYAHPMASANLGNRIPDEVVESLHRSVREVAAPLAQRFYRLKARLLGLDTLRWSDRNAPLPFADYTRIPYPEALTSVRAAYAMFSPTLAVLVDRMANTGRIDAPMVPGKHSGAYNCSFGLSGGGTDSFVLLNYLGKPADVMTLAHELGHAVHGLLAGEAQGPLLMRAPTPYAETASVFGEMTTFIELKKRIARSGDARAALSLLCGKIGDILNTSVRQISFSEFERKAHGAHKRLSPEEFNALWMEVTQDFYGPAGETFTYDNAERLWCYIPHFHRPFYVYGYAFGELLTQSLYARAADFSERFEPLYLEMLRAGGSKDVVELLAPFGLDPRSDRFWSDGIQTSLGKMVSEAEALADQITSP